MSTTAYTPAPGADFVLPFDLPKLHLRGRFVRLDGVSRRALGFQNLPEPVARIAAESMALTGLLGSALKLEGRLSLQARGDGPLNLLASDFFAGGGLRGYVRMSSRAEFRPDMNFGALVGEGALALTIEPKPGAQSYQGLVPMEKANLASSAEAYFEQSEQLPTMLKLAAGENYVAGEGSSWRSGGLMVQAVPGAQGTAPLMESDDWRRVQLFLDTLEPLELLDTGLAPERILWRLFHEDEVRVHPAQTLHFQCTCNAEKVLPVLRSYPKEEMPGLADADEIIRARCEFCGTAYEFPLSTFI